MFRIAEPVFIKYSRELRVGTVIEGPHKNRDEVTYIVKDIEGKTLCILEQYLEVYYD